MCLTVEMSILSQLKLAFFSNIHTILTTFFVATDSMIITFRFELVLFKSRFHTYIYRVRVVCLSVLFIVCCCLPQLTYNWLILSRESAENARLTVHPRHLVSCMCCRQGWKPKPENPVLKKILETQTETDTYSAKFLKA